MKRSVRPFSSPRSSTTASNSSVSSKGGRFKKSQGSYLTVAEEPEEEEGDDEDLEKDPEAYETYMQDQHQRPDEDEDGEELEDEVSENESLTPEDLKEAWAAGWRAIRIRLQKRKGRNFRNPALSKTPRRDQKPDTRKAATTCSSCGVRGHWKGDPECIKVKTGADKPFQPKTKPKNVHFVTNDSRPFSTASQISLQPTNAAQVATQTRRVSLFMRSISLLSLEKDSPRERKDLKLVLELLQQLWWNVMECLRCQKPMDYKANFCSDCGSSMALLRVVDQDDKRSWGILTYASSSEEDVPGCPSQPSNLGGYKSNLAPRPKPLVAPPWESVDAQSACSGCSTSHVVR